MTDSRGPTGYRVSLGKELKQLRENADLSRDDVAREFGWDLSKLSKIEGGKAVPRVAEIAKMLDLYKADDSTRERIENLASHARKRGRFGKTPDWARTYLGLEPDATDLMIFYGEIVPGLFQDENYARALVGTSQAVAAADVEPVVEARKQRRNLLHRQDPPPPRVRVVIGQSAIVYAVGGHRTMVQQIDLLIELFQLPHVTGQIIPWEGGAHAALGNNFIVLTADTGGEETQWVYTEDLARADCTPDPSQVRLHRLTFDSLMVNALSERDTLALLKRTRDDHEQACDEDQ